MEGTLRYTLVSQTQHAHSLENHTGPIQQSTSTYTKQFPNMHPLWKRGLLIGGG